MTFTRRFLFDPGLAEITAIEGIVIIDREPPASIVGVGSGPTVIVGEFENGPFNTPTELSSGSDFQNMFGGFGFEYDGISSNNPAARTRRADGATTDEFWNGNGFVAAASKKYRRLMVVRVDTTVGEVQFDRLACIDNTLQAFTYNLTAGQILSFDIGAGALDTTFDAAVGSTLSGAGVYPSTFTGGETMNVTIDAGTTSQIGPVDIVFQAADQTQAQVLARINTVLGYTADVDTGGNTSTLSGRIQGTAGSVQINSIDALVATATGHSVTTNAGTGDVADITQVTAAEVIALVTADTVGAVSIEKIGSTGLLRACNLDSAAGQTIETHANTTAVNLGFVVDGVVASNSVGTAGTIPAGTRVRNAGADEWVTAQDVAVTADNPGPYTVTVRPADDDGTGLAAATGTVNVVPFAPTIGSFAVTNLLPITAALTEAAIDAAYLTAIDSTLNPNAVTKQANIIVSARQSNTIRTGLRTNALEASAGGLFGRMAVIRPPLNTTRAVAKSTTSQPGVGAYRDQRVVYAYPGASTFLPQIADRGLDGGAGFTADGIIDVGFDTWVASIMSQLPPENNPGELTGFATAILGVERNNPDVQDLREADYRSFKASGIAALKMEDGTATIQSGKTSVDPAVFPNLQNINRRRMADFIQDSLAERLKAFSKKTNTLLRRSDIFGETDGFLSSLRSINNEASQRIDDYSLDGRSGNTQAALAQGVYRLIIKVRTLSTLDDIILDTEIGESVIIAEAA